MAKSRDRPQLLAFFDSQTDPKGDGTKEAEKVTASAPGFSVINSGLNQGVPAQVSPDCAGEDLQPSKRKRSPTPVAVADEPDAKRQCPTR